MRRRICAGNWKMFKTGAEAAAFVEQFAEPAAQIPASVETVICPPFTALEATSAALRRVQGQNGRIKLGAQNMHWEKEGAFTGEISAPMLISLGVQFVILGHSERRRYFGETDEYVRLKTRAALQEHLTPIVAVGEPLEIRERGETQAYVLAQVRAALSDLDPGERSRITIAYEPVWAIGTGHNCDPSEANEVMRAIRSCLDGLDDVPILYGGSVKAGNIAQYAAQPDIDGALVGGASLSAVEFARLAKEAA